MYVCECLKLTKYYAIFHIRFTGEAKFLTFDVKVEGSVINKAMSVGIEFVAGVNDMSAKLCSTPTPGKTFERVEEKSSFMKKVEISE